MRENWFQTVMSALCCFIVINYRLENVINVVIRTAWQSRNTWERKNVINAAYTTIIVVYTVLGCFSDRIL